MIHSGHDIVTVVLESQKLSRDLNLFKGAFEGLNKEWNGLYNNFSSKKDNFEHEVDKTCKSIENHFDYLIKKLEESKRKYIEAFKVRAKGEIKEFLTEYDNFNSFYANVKHKENELKTLETLYETSNDFDLVKESSLQNNDHMFKTFCPEYTDSLKEYKDKFQNIEDKVNYTFHFETGTEEDELINSVHKNIKIKMKLEEDKNNDFDDDY